MNNDPRQWIVQAILDKLEELGPMSRIEIQMAIGMGNRDRLGSTMLRLCNKTKRLPKRIHICDWIYDGPNNSRYYPRAVFAIGDKPDKKKPKRLSQAECSRRWRAKNNALGTNSIFAMGYKARIKTGARIAAAAGL